MMMKMNEKERNAFLFKLIFKKISRHLVQKKYNIDIKYNFFLFLY